MASDEQENPSPPSSSEDNAGQNPSSSRRKFLQRSGILVAAIGAYGVPAAQANISQSASTSSDVAATKPYSIDLDVVDHIDGYFVVRPNLRVNLNGSVKTVTDMRLSDGLSIEITQGEGKVVEDPYTGNILIAATGSVPVKARGVLRPLIEHSHGEGHVIADPVILGNSVLIGEETHIGIASHAIAQNQLSIAASGGGACPHAVTSLSSTSSIPHQLVQRLQNLGFSAEAMVNMAKGYRFSIRVRASFMANVIPYDDKTRVINWRHGLYYAYDKVLGRMRLYYNPDPAYRSKTIMRSDALVAGAHNFFPASGVNQLYFILDFLDIGYRCFNKEPMNLFFNNAQWPPYATPLDIEKPVQFYNLDNHDEVILTVNENAMQIYDYASVDIENLHNEVDPRGLIRTRWRIRNQATNPIQGQWFALGDFVGSKDLPDQGSYQFSAGGTAGDTLEVDFVGRLQKSKLKQMITMNLVSYDDPVVVGTKELHFRYPD